jgi:ATP-binding cassette subfamily B (MDR/TAP) protein 1
VRNADIIFVLRHGSVCEQGSHDDLMAKEGEYFCLVQSQEGEHQMDVASVEPNTTELSKDESKMSGSSAKQKSVSDSQLQSEKDKEAAVAKEMKEAGFKTPMGRLFVMMRPEWPIAFVAAMAALVAGSVMPINGRALSGAVKTMYIPLMPGGSEDEMLD